jgi:hypothetical protein
MRSNHISFVSQNTLFFSWTCLLYQGLAITFYGTHSTKPSSPFDVISYTNMSQTDLGAALIHYTDPGSSSFISWGVLSHAENQTSATSGAPKLLDDLQAGMGRSDW